MGVENFAISVYLPLKMWYYGNIGKLEKSVIEEINLSSLFCAIFWIFYVIFLKEWGDECRKFLLIL